MNEQELQEIVDEVMDAIDEEDLPENAQYTTYYGMDEETEPSGW